MLAHQVLARLDLERESLRADVLVAGAGIIRRVIEDYTVRSFTTSLAAN